MTRKQAHLLVKTTNGPVGWIARCPYCGDCTITVRKSATTPPLSWGERTRFVARVANHIIEAHAGEAA